jgi:hypothetical protein
MHAYNALVRGGVQYARGFKSIGPAFKAGFCCIINNVQHGLAFEAYDGI